MMFAKRYDIAIGIDTGVSTGFAIWNRNKKCFDEISTLKLHRAIFKIKDMHDRGYNLIVIVEDARKATFGRQMDYHKAQGAGSVKRDAKMIEDFLEDYKIPYELKRPVKARTKMDKETFARVTGYRGLTSSHGRDASLLVFGM